MLIYDSNINYKNQAVRKYQFVEGFCGRDKHGVTFDEEIERQYTEYIEESYRRFIKEGDQKGDSDPNFTLFEDLGKFDNTARYLMKNRIIKYEDAEKVMKSLYNSADIELKTEFLEYVRTLDNSDELL